MESEHNGFWGRILRINLTDGTWDIEKPDPGIYRRYMGGRSLALYYLLNEMESGVEPLGPDNKLIFMTSPTTGAPISGQARHTVAARSPLTGGIADSQSGGWWGAELKFAGWDGIIVEGQSSKPVYVNIEDDNVEILDAENLWGKRTGDVQDSLQEIHSNKHRIVQIGPAAENLVRFAAITSDLRHYSARGGIGTVMGSKRLRAIAVRGSNRKLKIADSEKLKEIAGWFNRSVKDHPALSVQHELGTPKGVVPLNVMGLLPNYNFQDGSFDNVEAVSGETMEKEIGAGTHTCFACAVSCKRSVKGESGAFAVTDRYGGPEYESLDSLGPQLGVDNLVAISQANELCNALGMDTISSGVTIAWAVECFERGLITKEDTGGIELKWGDPETNLKLLQMIADREGFGDILAEGSMRASQKLGRGTEKYTMQVKGQEIPAHEPRGKWGVGLGYAVSPTGADHLQAGHDTAYTEKGDFSKEFNWADLEDLSPLGIIDPIPAEELSPAKVRLFMYLQFIWGLHDVLDWCIFTTVPEVRAIGLNKFVEVVSAITGWRTSLFELLKAGERGITMARAFNCREGFTSEDDTLPDRFFEPMREGNLKDHYIDPEEFKEALQLYYGMMGWNEQGVPTRAKLAELDIDWVWDKLN